MAVSLSSQLGSLSLGSGQLGSVASVGTTSTQTISGQSFIQGLISSKTLSGESNIATFTARSIPGFSTIKNNTLPAISGFSSIVLSAVTRLDVGPYQTTWPMFVGPLQTLYTLTQVKSLPGQSNLSSNTQQTISGSSDVLAFTSQPLTGQSVIGPAGVTTRNIQGSSAVVRISTRSLVGFSVIFLPSTKTILGQSVIQRNPGQTVAGASNILAHTSQLLTGQSVIYTPFRFLNGFSNIIANTARALAGQSFVVVETTPPTSPGLLSATGTGSVTLNWTASTDPGNVLTAYVIQRTPCSGGAWITIATVSNTTLTYTDNPGPGCYVYRVYSENAFGQTSGYSPNAAITVGLTTTNQNLSGLSCVQSGTLQSINGQSVIFTSTPAMAVQITQASEQVSLNKDPNIQITQASMQVSENRKNNVQVTQVVLQVAMPYLGSYNRSFPGGTNNRGQG